LPLLNTQESQALLQQIAKGDEKAFRLLFDTYRGKLFYYISRFVKSEQVAEELVMDVFMKIWTGRELVTQINNWEAFLFRIAHNKSIDFLRAAANNFRMKELLWQEIQVASGQQADSVLLAREYEAKLREAVSLLSPQRRITYNLSREQYLTHDQIAAKLKISGATVNNHLVEAQRFIRNHLIKSFDLATVILLASRL
jgi:RNA polymerase sigma-70 factor (ECF subfamily)